MNDKEDCMDIEELNLEELDEKEIECQKHLENADEYYTRGDKLSALKEAEIAGKYCPNDVYVLHTLMIIHGDLGNARKEMHFARLCFNEIVNLFEGTKVSGEKLEPEIATMLGNIALIFQKNDEDVLRCFEIAMGIDPENVQTLYARQFYYLDNGLIEDAMRDLDLAYKQIKHISDPRKADIVTNLSYCYYMSGMTKESFDLLKEYLKSNPPTGNILRNLAFSCLDLELLDESIHYFKKLMKLEPESPVPHAGVAVVYALRGWKKEAYSEIRIALKLNEKKRDEEAEELILDALEILEDDDRRFRFFLFLYLLMMKAGMERRFTKR